MAGETDKFLKPREGDFDPYAPDGREIVVDWLTEDCPYHAGEGLTAEAIAEVYNIPLGLAKSGLEHFLDLENNIRYGRYVVDR